MRRQSFVIAHSRELSKIFLNVIVLIQTSSIRTTVYDSNTLNCIIWCDHQASSLVILMLRYNTNCPSCFVSIHTVANWLKLLDTRTSKFTFSEWAVNWTVCCTWTQITFASWTSYFSFHCCCFSISLCRYSFFFCCYCCCFFFFGSKLSYCLFEASKSCIHLVLASFCICQNILCLFKCCVQARKRVFCLACFVQAFYFFDQLGQSFFVSCFSSSVFRYHCFFNCCWLSLCYSSRSFISPRFSTISRLSLFSFWATLNCRFRCCVCMDRLSS